MDDNGKLQVQLLDLDGSLSSTAACAKAIEASLKRLGIFDKPVVLQGQTTDSGGGGVLDGLARELNALGLTVELDQYLVAPCSIHALNLQLSYPTDQLMGGGALSKQNMMQMLHSMYALQDKFSSFETVATMMDAAQEFAEKYCDTDYVPDPNNRGDVEFAERYNRVRSFYNFQPIGATRWRKIKQCVTTQWQYTGEAAKYGLEYYLAIFKFTQMCINSHRASNMINGIASDLQSMMM